MYPKAILTVGDEVRKARLDRGITQHELARNLNVNLNFISQLELGRRKITIFTLHKAYTVLGSIPKTLHIDESTLSGKIFAHRIRYGYTYSVLSERTKVSKKSLIRCERGRNVSKGTLEKLSNYFDN